MRQDTGAASLKTELGALGLLSRGELRPSQQHSAWHKSSAVPSAQLSGIRYYTSHFVNACFLVDCSRLDDIALLACTPLPGLSCCESI